MVFFSWLLTIACLIFVILTFNVIKNRRRTGQALGNQSNDASLERAVSAHRNFTEITPFAFSALWLLTQTNIPQSVLLIVGSLFLIGRISHAVSLIYVEPVHNLLKFRIFGMMTSFLTILFGISVFLLYQF